MGYQAVEATLTDYKTRRGVAYNGELLLFDEEPHSVLRTATYPELLNRANKP